MRRARETARVSGDRPGVQSTLVVACLAGNFMEWFDFAVFGFFATTIGKVFFQSKTTSDSLLAALAVFGVAFVFRPLGGALFGAIGDRSGRRAALSSAIILMTISTALIAALPSYAAAGVLAPILLVVLRALQGVSAGGEWTGASTFLVEWAPAGRRGLWGSLISASAAVSFILGGLIALALTSWLTGAQMTSWGWRVPFVVAAPLGVVGLYVRLRVQETPVFRRLEREQRVAKSPLRQIARRDKRLIALVFVVSGITGLGLYYFATYMVNYMSATVGFGRPQAILLVAVGLGIYAALCPVAGMLSDRLGRRPVYVVSCVGLAVLAVPIFVLAGTRRPGAAIVALCLFAICQAGLNVTNSAWLTELFPATTRLTGASIGHNLGVGIISGSGPLVAAWLVSVTGSDLAPAGYLLALATIASLVMLRWLPETFDRDLSAEEPTSPRAGGSAPLGAPRPAEATT